MNPSCARCSKTVYPVEKLNCLDKTWHKKCFTCQTCNMKLTMKNYKGYNKYPYCNAHYPKGKFTAVADTPEQLRLKKQTESQSQVEYHKKFEEERGSYTATSGASNQQQSVMGSHGAQDRHQQAQPQSYTAPPQTYHAPPPETAPAPAPVPAMPQQVRYRAIYDYTAADEDEISFQEDDIIIDVTIIDSGWMEGRNQSTGDFGMLPSNYVAEI